jgi:dTDP-4-amino-4,6-dideoxygalactose transaminase
MPLRESVLPFARPHITDAEVNEVAEAMRSYWLTTGPRVTKFEEALSAYFGGVEAVAVNSGTAALHLALLAAGIGPGDEVITTPLTWAATSNMILLVGARPVFVDIDRESLNMRAECVEAAVTERTKAIMPVHFAGLSCDMTTLRRVAQRHNLAIIEDAAHCFGSTCNEGLCGTIGLAGCLSFHPTKPITTGEGGALLTRDAAVAEKARLLGFHGVTRGARARTSGTGEYEVAEVGFKYNMLDMQAAVGLHQVPLADAMRQRRQELAGRYRQLLGDLDGDLLFLPKDAPDGWQHSWHLYVIKLNLDRLTIDRAGFRAALKERNIATGLHYRSLHIEPLYVRELGCRPGDFEEALWASERVVSIPLFADMTEDDLVYSAAMTREVLCANAR